MQSGNLIEAGYAALERGEVARARDLLEQSIASGAVNATVWLALARARAALKDEHGELEALNRALALEPRNLPALLAKGDHLLRNGDRRAAVSHYGPALKLAAAAKNLTPSLQEPLRRAQAAIDTLARELETHVRDTLSAKGFDERNAPPRFARAVDILLGKRRPFVQAPRYFYFPELPQVQFYERSDFAWAPAIEAHFREILEELERLVPKPDLFPPYVSANPNRPAQAGNLVDNPDWGAFFLKKDGQLQPGAESCPATWRALQLAPLTQIPDRAPSVLFSRLAAGAHIPPHTGMINARLICHLPLIVPEDCRLRVGNEIRSWTPGELLIFDDSMEHEAWNRSAFDRYVLLFDVWRPELSAEERLAVVSLCEAIDAFGREKIAWDA